MTEIWCDGTHNEHDLMKILKHNIIVVNKVSVSGDSKGGRVGVGR